MNWLKVFNEMVQDITTQVEGVKDYIQLRREKHMRTFANPHLESVQGPRKNTKWSDLFYRFLANNGAGL